MTEEDMTDIEWKLTTYSFQIETNGKATYLFKLLILPNVDITYNQSLCDVLTKYGKNGLQTKYQADQSHITQDFLRPMQDFQKVKNFQNCPEFCGYKNISTLFCRVYLGKFSHSLKFFANGVCEVCHYLQVWSTVEYTV